MKSKNIRIIALAAALVLIAAVAIIWTRGNKNVADYGKERLLNSRFEEQSEHWNTDAYVSTPGYTEYAFREGEGRDGSNALYIRNNELNDARFWQQIQVQPDTLYLISAVIRANAEGGLGANVSVEGVYVFSDSVYDTQGEWQEVKLCGRTGKNQHSLVVYLRLGGYSGEALGEAWFDQVSVTAVSKAPEGLAVQGLAPAEPQQPITGSQQTAMGLIVLTSLLYAAICLLLARLQYTEALPALEGKRAVRLGALIGILIAGLAIRLIAAVTITGYDVDVNDFRIWADIMYREGPVRFYSAAGFCDYPPGYLLILWLLGFAGQFTGGTSALLVKLPSIIADLCTCALLYRMAGEKKRTGLILSLLYALSPLAVCAGAAWGQGDSVMILLLLLVVWKGMQQDWLWALPLYGLSVLVKPQSLMFGPLGLAAAIPCLIKAYKERGQGGEKVLKRFGLGFLIMCAVMAAVVLPFCIGQGGIKWLFDLYGSTMGSYGFATVNACNLYFLFGLNWLDAGSAAPVLLVLAAAVLVTAPLCLSVFFQQRKEKWIVLGACAVPVIAALIASLAGALTISALGYLLIAVSVAEVLYLYLRESDPIHLPLCGAALLCLMFAGGAMMHERYLFPASALLLIAWLKEKDRRILYLFILVTLSCFINTACVLDRNMRIGGSAGHLNAPLFAIQSDLAPLEIISAVLNVISAPLTLYICADRCRADAPAWDAREVPAEAPEAPAEPDFLRHEKRPGMDRKDWLILGVITAVFCAFTLTNLGSVTAPQTSCVLPRLEGVVLDLGKETDFQLLYYPGIHYPETSAMTIEVSNDGENYLHMSEESITPGDCFRWIYAGGRSDPMHARYIRVTANNTGITLFEMLARTPEGVSLPMTVSDSKLSALADEPDTLKGEPGWFNSMYFDEIYHGRTAYELLHGLTIYEWTHPPLGKVLMSLSVAVFGMTPFGWRFAGAMMGVLMIPGLYLMARLLLKKRACVIGAVLLLCFDFMHFTQTRIATIDSFVVCFIIWSYYFMLSWFFMDYWNKPFLKTLVPLACSGLFMGLSIASKWTGCYAAVGLAVLFFWGFFRRLRDVIGLQNGQSPADDAGEKRAEVCRREGKRRLIVTIACCFGFFIAVPLLIYYCSYIPFFAASGGISAERVIDQARGMLAYHAEPGRGMDHYFYSPWYQWPLIAKPMWYYSTAYAPEGYGSTIISFGNPAVWWTGALSLLAVAGIWIGRHTDKNGLTLKSASRDPVPAILILSFLAQFLPWVLVPRGTYIYHYFACVPFIILANAYLWDLGSDRFPRAMRWVIAAQVLLALGLFIAFFPYLSGVTAPTAWLEAMKWFPNWLWY